MISKCANPGCSVPFDHRGGRFFRFRSVCAPHEPPANAHSVRHFWLCSNCAQTHTLDDRSGAVQVVLRMDHPNRARAWRPIAAA